MAIMSVPNVMDCSVAPVLISITADHVIKEYPTSAQVMADLQRPYPNELKMVEEFIKGRDDYPQSGEKLGISSDELARLADFMAYFCKEIGLKTKIYFGAGAYGTLYFHKFDQIHINIADLTAGLHEIGHALYGESELRACAYSTGLILAATRDTSKGRAYIPVFVGHKLINGKHM